jgi:holo-[acyl-carrier protein] synthase
MNVGVGIDLVSIPRMKGLLDRWGERFLSRVFTKTEIAYCLKRSMPAVSLAARFAAKEAFYKAVSGRETGTIGFKDIEVVVDKDGKPRLEIYGAARRALAGWCASLSLSHEQDLAVAIVVTSPEVRA